MFSKRLKSIALTTTAWADRNLGESREVRLPVLCTWLATSNNAQLHEDLVTRSVLIRLDPGVERPEERKGFAVPHPPTEVRRNRGKWLDDALVLVRHWLDKGAPRYAGSGVSRFGDWSAVMGGLLEAIGEDGFLGNYGQLAAAANPEMEAWRAFVAAWAERFDSQKVTVGTHLYGLAFGDGTADWEDGGSSSASPDGMLTEYLDADNRGKRLARLGKALKTRKDRVFAGWKLRSEGGATTKHWLERAIEADEKQPRVQDIGSGGCAERDGGMGVMGVVSAIHDLNKRNRFSIATNVPVVLTATPTTPIPPRLKRQRSAWQSLPSRVTSDKMHRDRLSDFQDPASRGNCYSGADEADWDGTSAVSAFDAEGELLPWDHGGLPPSSNRS